MKERWSRALALLVLAGAAVLAAAAPSPAREGFTIGAELLFNSIDGSVNTGGAIASGNGLGLRAGFGLHRLIALETSVWSTDHEAQSIGNIVFEGASLDVKLTFPLANSHVEPFLLGGAGAYRLGTQKGNGGEIGIGMDIALVPQWSIAVGMTRRIIDFDAPAGSSAADVTSMGFTVFYRIP